MLRVNLISRKLKLSPHPSQGKLDPYTFASALPAVECSDALPLSGPPLLHDSQANAVYLADFAFLRKMLLATHGAFRRTWVQLFCFTEAGRGRSLKEATDVGCSKQAQIFPFVLATLPGRREYLKRRCKTQLCQMS